MVAVTTSPTHALLVQEQWKRAANEPVEHFAALPRGLTDQLTLHLAPTQAEPWSVAVRHNGLLVGRLAHSWARWIGPEMAAGQPWQVMSWAPRPTPEDPAHIWIVLAGPPRIVHIPDKPKGRRPAPMRLYDQANQHSGYHLSVPADVTSAGWHQLQGLLPPKGMWPVYVHLGGRCWVLSSGLDHTDKLTIQRVAVWAARQDSHFTAV